MKLSIYKINKHYGFSIGKFASNKNSNYFNIKPIYSYPFEACHQARSLIRNNKNELEYFNKHAEDLTREVYVEQDPEDMLMEHYKTLLKEMTQTVLGIDDEPEDDKKITYEILKSQVSDLMRLEEQVPDKKPEITKLLNGYRKIAQKHFHSYLQKEKQEKDAVAVPTEDINVPEMPQDMDSEIPFAPTDINNPTIANIKKELRISSKMDIKDIEEEICDHYGFKVCNCLKDSHPNVIYKVDNKNINLIDGNKKILTICLNDDLICDNIFAQDEVNEMFPSFSTKFYQKYFKPVVEAIGHFYLEEQGSILLPDKKCLPNISDKESELDVISFNLKNKDECPVKLCVNKTAYGNSWKIVKSDKIQRELTEEELLRNQPALVKCIDKSLDLFGKTGEVVQIVSLEGDFEVDVNFGRKIVRLTKSQIELYEI